MRTNCSFGVDALDILATRIAGIARATQWAAAAMAKRWTAGEATTCRRATEVTARWTANIVGSVAAGLGLRLVAGASFEEWPVGSPSPRRPHRRF